MNRHRDEEIKARKAASAQVAQAAAQAWAGAAFADCNVIDVEFSIMLRRLVAEFVLVERMNFDVKTINIEVLLQSGGRETWTVDPITAEPRPGRWDFGFGASVFIPEPHSMASELRQALARSWITWALQFPEGRTATIGHILTQMLVQSAKHQGRIPYDFAAIILRLDNETGGALEFQRDMTKEGAASDAVMSLSCGQMRATRLV